MFPPSTKTEFDAFLNYIATPQKYSSLQVKNGVLNNAGPVQIVREKLHSVWGTQDRTNKTLVEYEVICLIANAEKEGWIESKNLAAINRLAKRVGLTSQPKTFDEHKELHNLVKSIRQRLLSGSSRTKNQPDRFVNDYYVKHESELSKYPLHTIKVAIDEEPAAAAHLPETLKQEETHLETEEKERENREGEGQELGSREEFQHEKKEEELAPTSQTWINGSVKEGIAKVLLPIVREARKITENEQETKEHLEHKSQEPEVEKEKAAIAPKQLNPSQKQAKDYFPQFPTSTLHDESKSELKPFEKKKINENPSKENGTESQEGDHLEDQETAQPFVPVVPQETVKSLPSTTQKVELQDADEHASLTSKVTPPAEVEIGATASTETKTNNSQKAFYGTVAKVIGAATGALLLVGGTWAFYNYMCSEEPYGQLVTTNYLTREQEQQITDNFLRDLQNIPIDRAKTLLNQGIIDKLWENASRVAVIHENPFFKNITNLILNPQCAFPDALQVVQNPEIDSSSYFEKFTNITNIGTAALITAGTLAGMAINRIDQLWNTKKGFSNGEEVTLTVLNEAYLSELNDNTGKAGIKKDYDPVYEKISLHGDSISFDNELLVAVKLSSNSHTMIGYLPATFLVSLEESKKPIQINYANEDENLSLELKLKDADKTKNVLNDLIDKFYKEQEENVNYNGIPVTARIAVAQKDSASITHIDPRSTLRIHSLLKTEAIEQFKKDLDNTEIALRLFSRDQPPFDRIKLLADLQNDADIYFSDNGEFNSEEEYTFSFPSAKDRLFLRTYQKEDQTILFTFAYINGGKDLVLNKFVINSKVSLDDIQKRHKKDKLIISLK